jgi:hypothetical protein
MVQANPPDRYYQAFVVIEPEETAHIEVDQDGGRP